MIDAIELYPTPDDLAEKMVRSIGKANPSYKQASFPKKILEPSAGTGNLVKAFERVVGFQDRKYFFDTYDVDCIEVSAECRAILKGNGFRVIHDDFLTFDPFKKYDAILMNPPFSNGAKHLMKAIDIMKNGGMIRCLLSAETVRNPYTNERKELVRRLEELHADISYIQHAFVESANPTNVEVAFVSIDIPKKKPESQIRLSLQREYKEKLSHDLQLNALVTNDPIAAAIERYKVAAHGLQRIYEEYEGIMGLLSSPVGNTINPAIKLDKDYDTALRDLRVLYWKGLFDIPSIRDNLTDTMRNEYSQRITELAEYDFSKFNIMTIRQEIAMNTVAGIENEIVALFDSITRLHYAEYSNNIHYYNGWCTNSAYKINKKIVFPCNAFCTWFDGHYDPTRWDVIRQLSNMELTLHYLDTNGKSYDSTQLRQTLQNAREAKQTKSIQCHYFKVTFYKKGTCHLEFTNLDVLKTFNAFAAQHKNWLPPSYGKAEYQKMDQESKAVIDSFEGADSYSDSFDRGLIQNKQTLLQIAG